MTVLTEGNLQIEFPHAFRVWKFDNPESHGLSHCMKAVDFIIEEGDFISFIELKDPDNPNATDTNSEEFISKFLSGGLDEDLKYKFRDTFLYQWARGGLHMPICYWVIIASERLTEAELGPRTDELRRKLPLKGPSSGQWNRQIVENCMVFNIKSWNKHRQRFPMSRIT